MFKEMLWKGQVLWGMMVYDSLRAMDFLLERPDVDPARIATLGISMGSTMAWWLAALDERVKVTVDICCLTDFKTLMEKKNLSAHGVYYFVPGLLKKFTTAQINALIAPRAHLGLAGPPGQAHAGRRASTSSTPELKRSTRNRAIPSDGSCSATTSVTRRPRRGAGDRGVPAASLCERGRGAARKSDAPARLVIPYAQLQAIVSAVMGFAGWSSIALDSALR